MIIFVLHGFASATPNDNSAAMKEMYPDATVVNLNYEFDPDVGMKQVVNDVNVVINKNPYEQEIYFIGCSLGGFVARYLAYVYASSAIALNPAVFPEESLTRWLGQNTNYKTDVTFELTEENVRNYAKYHAPEGTVPTLVLLDEADDVIDSAATAKHFNDKAEVHMFPGGSHRFEHLRDSKPIIDRFMNEVIL